jgi:KDO2-lipid IV(A) lauroyltransferase
MVSGVHALNSSQKMKNKTLESSNLSQRSPSAQVAAESEPPIEENLSVATSVALVILNLIGSLPLSLRRSIGWTLGRLFALIPSREREVATLQLQAFLPGARPEQIVPKVFASLGQTVMEGLNLSPILERHQSLIRCAQPELFDWAITQGRPILGLTAHTGNWEVFAAYLNARGAKSVAIGRPARNHHVQQTLATIRSRAGIKILWRSGRAGMKDILQAFQDGYIVGALIDQDTRVRSLPVSFFGTPAQTPVTILEIAKRFEALFFSAFIIREQDGSYTLHIRKLDETANPAAILSEYHLALEEVIRAHPEQWVWFHKRWRTLPSGEGRSSKEYLKYLKERVINA